MSNKGYALYSFISFSPMLLAFAFVFTWSYWFLNQKHKVDNLCNLHTLKAQEILLKNNKYLLNLNTKAWALILEKRSLDAIILAAPPPVKIPAKARRRIVVAQQYTLKKLQKGILYKANLQARSQAYLLKKRFYKFSNQLSSYWQTERATSKIFINWKSSQLEPRFKEIAPPYKRVSQHSRLQQIDAHWEIPLQSIIPKWLRSFVKVKKIWRGECASYPKKRRMGWFAQIGRAKLLSKP